MAAHFEVLCDYLRYRRAEGQSLDKHPGPQENSSRLVELFLSGNSPVW